MLRTALAVAVMTATGALPAAQLGSPTAPTDVVAVAGVQSASLSWTAPTFTPSGPVIAYLVTADNLTTGQSSAPEASNDGTEPTDLFTGLTAGDTYTFTVRARTTNGQGEDSDPSNQVVPTAPSSTVTTPAVTPAVPGPALTLPHGRERVRAGVVRLVLKCVRAACSGTIKLTRGTILLGDSRFRIADGADARIRVTLSAAAQRQVSSTRSHGLTVTLTASMAGRQVRSSSVVLVG